MPQNSNYRLPRGHRFRPKLDLTVMAPNHGGDPLGSILGPMGFHWGQNMGQNRKITMLQNSNFRLPRGHRFRPKLDLTVMAPNHGGDPLGSILGPMGFHWGQNMGQNRKITMLQNSNFRLPRGHRFRPKFDLTVMAPIHGGDPLGSILGPMGSHWGQKIGQNHKKLPWLKIRIFDNPAVIDFGQNLTLRLWRQITVGTP